MKTIVCTKWVLDEEQIKVDPNTRKPIYDRVPSKQSLYDRNAVEMAAALSTETGGTSAYLSIGGEAVKATRKEILARGIDEGFVVIDSRLKDADAYVTSNVLAAKIKSIGDADLVICAEGASDDYSQQVGARVAALLGWPVISYVLEAHVDDGKLTVKRAVDDGIESLVCTLPAVITTAGDCNNPRIPNFKAIMGAGKKPYSESDLSELGLDESKLIPKIRTMDVEGFTSARKHIMLEAKDPKELAAEAVRALIGEGVL